ncbi:MAG: hypothetical protein HKL90_04500 [Elusimicrobia bacterium]|nr:hypothetical protein [Elusimicrobiota bacterium]
MDPAREWSFFAAGTFALMGGSLIAGAEKRAADATAWENERLRLAGAPPTDRNVSFARFQRLLNRGFGVAALLAGGALAAGVPAGRGPRWSPSGAAAAAIGALLVISGVMGAAAGVLGRRSAPSFLRDESSRKAPPGERVSGALNWALRAWWFAYGARLLWGRFG